MNEQLKPLLKAEEDIANQITDWNQKKDKQISNLISPKEKVQIESLKLKLKEISDKSLEVNQSTENNNILNKINEYYIQKLKEIDIQLEKKEQTYKEVYSNYKETPHIDTSELILLQKMAREFEEKRKNHIKIMQGIEIQLENARNSYNLAKEAKFTFNKLHAIPSVDCKAFNTGSHTLNKCIDNSNKSQGLDKLKRKECLPLQQKAAKIYVNELKEKPMESLVFLEKYSPAEPVKARYGSSIRNNKAPIDKVKCKAENKENVTSKYKKYITKQTATKEILNKFNDSEITQQEHSKIDDSFPEPNVTISFVTGSKEPTRTLEQLIKGHNFYKKSTLKLSNKLPTFDPLNAKLCPPSYCGYILKHVKLSKGYDTIMIGDTSIPVKNIKRVNMPAEEKEIDLKNYYPFSIELGKDMKIELIATNYNDIKIWAKGIDLLIPTKE